MSFRSGATIVKETSLSPWLVIVKSVSEDPPPLTHKKKNHHQNLPELTVTKAGIQFSFLSRILARLLILQTKYTMQLDTTRH